MNNNILDKYLNNEKSTKITGYTLENIINLLHHLKNPHKNFKSLHIAGTNGKGSTAYMLSKILEKSGYKTGLYTSPHLLKINERIRINALDIRDSVLNKYLNLIDDIISADNSIEPTYFDVLTAAAFSYFSDQSVDISIIETGLGGRLDSTNIIIPEISIITDISMDHMNILGDTISQITVEKCGIIKPDIPVITSNTDTEIVRIIESYSGKNNSELYSLNKSFFTDNIRKEAGHFVFDYVNNDYKLCDIELPLFPEHQVKNAAVVITALNYLKLNGYPRITDDIIYEGLKTIIVPGRFQELSNHPKIIYDPAHNYKALNNMFNALEKHFHEKKKIFVISMMKDKADKKTLELYNNLDVIYYLLDDQRAYVPEKDEFGLVVSDENSLIDILKKISTDDIMIIFTGTFRIYNMAISAADSFKKDNRRL